MKEMTIYQKMTASTAELIKIVDAEIGIKCCQPFANRALDALNSLGIKTEAEARKASNVFLDNLQTLIQGGITSEDYDKIDLVKRGKTITISARVQALIRACRRKGFMVVDTFVAVPNDDDIYFEEVYKDGVGIIYLLKDKRVNTERDITADRLAQGYFKKFLCRLEIKDLANNRTIMTTTEMNNKEVLFAQSASDNGIFVSEWKKTVNKNGEEKKYKVVYDGTNGNELRMNTESIWYKWTSEMVKKTVIRRALKNIKEAIPELAQTIMAFDTDFDNTPPESVEDENVIEVEGFNNNLNVDLRNLTEDQENDVAEMFEIYAQNPASAMVDAEKINELYKSGKAINEIINEYYAELVNLSKSKKTYPLIENVLKGVPYEENKD